MENGKWAPSRLQPIPPVQIQIFQGKGKGPQGSQSVKCQHSDQDLVCDDEGTKDGGTKDGGTSTRGGFQFELNYETELHYEHGEEGDCDDGGTDGLQFELTIEHGEEDDCDDEESKDEVARPQQPHKKPQTPGEENENKVDKQRQWEEGS